MTAGRVVVVGGGQAGFQFTASLRAGGFAGEIALVCEEPHLPYMRPPLSKVFMKGEAEPADLPFRNAIFFREERIHLRLGSAVSAIDRARRQVFLASGEGLGYDRLVLATGASPRRLACEGAKLANVLCLRSLDDAAAIRDALPVASQVAVIGGGFIGLEFAAVASKLGKRVTVIEAGDRLMARGLSSWMSDWFLALHRRHGVDVRLRTGVAGIEAGTGRTAAVRLHDGTAVPADLVVVGIGVAPNVALAVDAGLAVDDGILVDAMLTTSDPAVFAIGDCARFPTPHTERPVRLESVQNAVDQAKFLAAAFSGHSGRYRAVPWFWTEQFEAKLQMAGLCTGHDQMRLSGDPLGSFSVEYFRDGQLVAVDSVNDARSHLAARRRLAETSLEPAASSFP